MKKYVLCISMILIGCQLHGMAGLRGYGSRIGAYVAQTFNNPQTSYAAINRYAQSLRQTTRLYTPKLKPSNDQTSYWAALKNAFSTMQRQASTTWSRHRTPITLSTLGVSSAGLAYQSDSIQNILGAQAVSAEEVMKDHFSQEQFDDYIKQLESWDLDDKEKHTIKQRLHKQLDDYVKQLEHSDLDDEEKLNIEQRLLRVAEVYQGRGFSVGEANRDHLAKLMCKVLNIRLDKPTPMAEMLEELRQSLVEEGPTEEPGNLTIEDLIYGLKTDEICTTNAADSDHIYRKGYFFIPRCIVNLLIEIGKDAELKVRVTQEITKNLEMDIDFRNSLEDGFSRDHLDGIISILEAVQEIVDGKHSATQEDYITYRIPSGGWWSSLLDYFK